MIDRGIARDGYPVKTLDGELLGHVTKRLPRPVPQEKHRPRLRPTTHTEPGTQLAVEIRNQLVKAEVVPLPFYKRPKRTTPPISIATPTVITP